MMREWACCIVLTVVACGPGADTEREPAAPASFLVLQKLGSSVAFYTADGDLLATVPVGKNPHEMILSADARHAYVTDYGALGVEEEAEGGTTITVIDIQARGKLGVIELGDFRRPHGIDLDGERGRLLVTTENPNRLLVIDPQNRQVVEDFATRGRTSHMVTHSPDGATAFVSNVATTDVSVIDLATGAAELIPVGERPEGSAVTGDGRTLFVACRESNIIAMVDTELNAVIGEIPTGRGPNRVRLTPDGRFAAYSLVHDHQIGIADVESRQQIATIDLDGAPVSLQLSADGERLLTASQDNDRVYVISIRDRRIVRQFSTARGTGPDPVLEIVGPQ
jgi:YVTN family beta-propeller protein